MKLLEIVISLASELLGNAFGGVLAIVVMVGLVAAPFLIGLGSPSKNSETQKPIEGSMHANADEK